MQYDVFFRRRLLTMSSTFRLLFYPSDPSQAAKEMLLEGGERKGVGAMVEGAGRQAEEIS